MLLSVEPYNIEIIIQLPPWILHVIPHNFVALSIEVQGTPNKFLWSSKVFHENVMEKKMRMLWNLHGISQSWMELHGSVSTLHETSWALHGIPWNYMEFPWNSMELHGTPWNSINIPWNSINIPWNSITIPWNSMELHGHSTEFHGTSMEFHGGSMELHGTPWNSMDLHGILWNSMEFHGIPWGYFTRVAFDTRYGCLFMLACSNLKETLLTLLNMEYNIAVKVIASQMKQILPRLNYLNSFLIFNFFKTCKPSSLISLKVLLHAS